MHDNPYRTNAVTLTDDELADAQAFAVKFYDANKDTSFFRSGKKRNQAECIRDAKKGKAAEIAFARLLRRGGLLTARADMVIRPGIEYNDNGRDIVGVRAVIDVKETKHLTGRLLASTMDSDVYVLCHVAPDSRLVTYKGHADKTAPWRTLHRGDLIPGTRGKIRAPVQYCLLPSELETNLGALVTRVRRYDGAVNRAQLARCRA